MCGGGKGGRGQGEEVGSVCLCGVGIGEEAAASLTSWSTSGLERLFTDLYQVGGGFPSGLRVVKQFTCS